jgi:DNA-binding transcriptional MerR regulator
MHSIGEMARASGLTVSALRFYDGAGLLVPAAVDPATGYRWYAEDQVAPARLLASLRRVGMPLADVARVLDGGTDAAAIRDLLDTHLRRLEQGLTDARRELARVHALLDTEQARLVPGPGASGRFVLDALALGAAVDAVRYAVCRDPELPMLHGVLFDVGPKTLRLVATDRYRLAVSEAPIGTACGPPRRLLVSVDFVDAARALLDRPGPVTLGLGTGAVCLSGGGRRVDGEPMDHEFPDYQRLLPAPGRRRVTVDGRRLRRALRAAVTRQVRREADGVATDVAVLTVDAAGQVGVAGQAGMAPMAGAGGQAGVAAGPGTSGAAGDVTRIGVNREFLLQALDASGAGQLTLELDGPIAPLALGPAGDNRTFSILMPVRL